MMSAPAILIMIHCEEHTGYAISSLEAVFHQAALTAGYTEDRIFWSFNGLKDTHSPNKIDCDYRNPKPDSLVPLLLNNNIQTVIAFDLGYPAKVIALLKNSGVKRIISYWGASMSSINTGIKLWLKKLDFLLRRNTPDHFIFESEAMRLTATHGRGVPTKATSVLYLGVDTEKFSPNYGNDFYAHEQLGIPKTTKIIFYSGHMEERKGVRVIINAALTLAQQNALEPLHFLLCGNKGNEAKTYTDMLIGSAAAAHVTFAGYRTDIARLMRSATLGVIASTGWDSFTMSSIEMMSSGLPLVVSDLQGLSETIEKGQNGYLITPGDYQTLATIIHHLCNDSALANALSNQSRLRALNYFTQQQQIQKLARIITNHD